MHSDEATNEAGPHQAFATVQVFAGITLGGVDLRVRARPALTLDPLTVTTGSQVGPTITPVFLNGIGQASVPFTIPTNLGLTSVYVQAMYSDATLGHFVMTNKVSVRSAFP